MPTKKQDDRKPVAVAVVGYGYWGPNLTRNLAETPGAVVHTICDSRPDVLAKAKSRHPGARCTESFDEVIADPEVDAVVIVTPVSTHAELATRALDAGKHVLVAKPLADTSAAAQRIVDAAERNKRVLLVDHTFVYMGAVQKVRDLVASGELGNLYYFDSVRVNLGLYQHDVSVLWDLAVHDLSILFSWIPQRPTSVACIAVKHLPGHPEDVGYLTLLYPDNLIAHVHVNWLSPVKVRRTLLGGSRKMVLFDDLDAVEKIKVYDRGVTPQQAPVGPGQIPLAYRRTGDVWIPQFDMTEALAAETAHFIRCIRDGEAPLTDGRTATDIIRVLEAAEESVRRDGQAVRLKQ